MTSFIHILACLMALTTCVTCLDDVLERLKDIAEENLPARDVEVLRDAITSEFDGNVPAHRSQKPPAHLAAYQAIRKNLASHHQSSPVARLAAYSALREKPSNHVALLKKSGQQSLEDGGSIETEDTDVTGNDVKGRSSTPLKNTGKVSAHS